MSQKRDSGGFTVVEIMVVVAIAAMVASAAIMGFSSLSRTRLKSSAYLIAAAGQRAFSYSTARNENVRLVIDFDSSTLTFESAAGDLLIDREKMDSGREEKEEEKEEEEMSEETVEDKQKEKTEDGEGKFSLGLESLAERIKSGFHEGEVPRYKAPKFSPIGGRHFAQREIDRGVKFFAVYSQLFEEEKREGVAYVYFFTNGTADHTAIQLQATSGEIYTVEILPFGARVKIYDYPFVPEFESEKEDEK